MSGIAEVLLNLGFEVTGSDLRKSDTTDRLNSLGARITFRHTKSVVEGVDVVVYSSAVSLDNPEVEAARELEIPVIQRIEMMAELMRLKFAVSVGGSHGKTSTTSMVASVLAHGGLDPTVVVGGKLKALRTNARLGSSRYIVVEADESDGQFVRLPSSIAVITNIDAEHLDYYGGMDAIKQGFIAYANRVPFYGAVVLCADDDNVMSIAGDIKRRKVTYALDREADVRGQVVHRADGVTRFDVESAGQPLGQVALAIPGDHYVRNALAAIAVGLEMEVPFSAIKNGLEQFEGVGRRFEVKGEAGGVLVVDDYGHHPTEVKATVQAAIANYERRVVVMFQPHRYSRTKALAADFASCFDGASCAYVTAIYPAGEQPITGVTSQIIIDNVRARGLVDIRYAPSIEEMVDSALGELRSGDLVLTMGAGDIGRAADLLLAGLRRGASKKP